MNWYVAKLVFRIVCGDGRHAAQFDEQLRLFKAFTKQEALEKARERGAAEAVSFPNQHNQTVQWQFIDVSDLYLVHHVGDGAELYSRIEEKDNAADYETFVRQKAQHIAEQTTSLQLT